MEMCASSDPMWKNLPGNRETASSTTSFNMETPFSVCMPVFMALAKGWLCPGMSISGITWIFSRAQ